MLGYEEHEIANNLRGWTQLVHPDDRNLVMAQLRRCRDGKEPRFELVSRFRHKNGETRWMHSQGTMLADPCGRAARLVGTSIDITQRRLADERLRFQAQLLDSVSESIVSTDLKGHIVYWSKGAEALYGHTAEEALGQDITLIAPADTTKQVAERMQQALADGQWRGQVVQQRKNATSFWADSVVSPVVDASGEPVGLVGIDRDITDRKMVQDDLEERLRFEILLSLVSATFVRLQQGELDAGVVDALERLGTFMAVDRGVVSLSDERRRTFHEVYAWTVAGAAREADIYGTLTVADRPWCTAQLLEGQAVVIPDVESLPAAGARDLRAWREVGICAHIAVPLLVAGHVRGFVALDVYGQTRYWSAETSRLQLVGEIFANAIEREQVNLAQMKLAADQPARTHIDKVVKAAERAANLTQQLLAYSGRGQFQIQPVNLNQILQENLHLFEVAIPKHIVLTSSLTEPLPFVDADTSQMQQVIMNLIINGAEAMEGSAGEVSVSTDVRQVGVHERIPLLYSETALPPGRYVTLTVQDNGAGMDKETLSRIFDPFFTTKHTGRGLGLAAVLGIVRGHHGGLQVESQPGAGTTFRLFSR